MSSTLLLLSVGCLLCVFSVSAQLGSTPMCRRICSAYCSGRRHGMFLCSWCECGVQTCGRFRCRADQICLRSKAYGWFGRSISSCMDIENKASTKTPIPETTTTITTTTTTTTTSTMITTTAAPTVHSNARLMIPLCAAGKVCTGPAQCGPGQHCIKEDELAETGHCCAKAVTNLKSKCMAKKVTGRCRAIYIRYFYNTTSFRCEQFVFGGCEKGPNHFETMEDCEHQCENRCLLPKEQGYCRALFFNFYYNRETGQCEQFQYYGCGENGNRFQKLEECNIECVDV